MVSSCKICIFILSTILITVCPCGIQPYKYHERLAYNHYRIKNDPKQVKPEPIKSDNLFQWLNLKNLVRFKLWTRMNSELAHEIKFDNVESLNSSNFDNRRLTKILIHGFADTATEASITYYLVDLKNAYLKLADLNVIIMDYSLFTIPLFYWTALPDVAAQRLSEFLSFMEKHGGLQLSTVHLIGFSWGSHVAGIAGHALNGNIGRITGLDPAGPTFRYVDNEFRLDKTDASFVDIIHTNAGKTLLFGGYLGLPDPLGHTDIYPNGGQKQIGCPRTTPLIYETLECSHGRAVRLFIESILSPLAFPSCKCPSLQEFVQSKCPCHPEDMEFMGEHISHTARGVRHLITKSRKPFGHGPHLEVYISNNTIFPDFRAKREILLVENVTEVAGSKTFVDLTVMYKNRTEVFEIRNPYLPENFPNSSIIEICRNMYAKMMISNKEQ